jgi:hypothetical protein
LLTLAFVGRYPFLEWSCFHDFVGRQHSFSTPIKLFLRLRRAPDRVQRHPWRPEEMAELDEEEY